MYTVVLSIPSVLEDRHRVKILDALARDLLTHHEYEPDLKIIVPQAGGVGDIGNSVTVDLREYPGLSFRFLPWNGYRNNWIQAYPVIRKVLAEEAARADVWHTGCTPGLWDLSTVAYNVGLHHASGLRIFCMDSDPAEMLLRSGRLDRITGRWVRARLRRRVRLADGVIFNGRGVVEMYGRDARRSVTAETVWLQEGELASEASTLSKFREPGPARLVVPARFTAWKGLDDVIAAVSRLAHRKGEFSVDLIGDGPMKRQLVNEVDRAGLGDTIRFLDPVPYGSPFFDLLRSYHAVLVPTRGLEEARVAYDAAASGCVLIHSRTATLDGALEQLTMRWTHAPGDPESLADAIARAFDRRDRWAEASLAGLRFMRGRTIDSMHRKRATFIARLRGIVASAPDRDDRGRRPEPQQ